MYHIPAGLNIPEPWWSGEESASLPNAAPSPNKQGTQLVQQSREEAGAGIRVLIWAGSDQNTCREVRGSRPVNTHRCLLSLLHGPNTFTDNTVKTTPPNTVSAGINSWRLVLSRLITRLLFISSSWNMLSKVRDNDLILMWLQRNVRQRNTLQRPHFLFSL